MVTLIKNTMLEKVKSAGALTDIELYKSMTKDGNIISEDQFNKLLLDFEILGLVKIAWVTKDGRRIEIVEDEPTQDNDDWKNDNNSNENNSNANSNGKSTKSSYDFAEDNNDGNSSNSNDADTSYEASFPGLEK